MASSLTPQGYLLKKLEDTKIEIENDLKTALGPGINLIPDQLLGQIVGIISERETLLNELGEDLYYSQYPTTANGISLDNVVAITGIKRLPGIPSTVTAVASGVQGTIIPAGSQVSVFGNPDALFETLVDHDIGPGTDEVQDITFDAVPDSGAFTLVFDGEETASLPFGAVAADVETALNNLTNLQDVTVTGDFTIGFTVTFTLQDGQAPQPLLAEGDNTLLDGVNPVVITFTETTPGVFPNVSMPMVATENGPTQALSGTLTVIETPIAGWDSVTNPLDAVLGRNIETDAELRLRRLLSLANPGTATLEAIRARLLQVIDVKAVAVYENITMIVDGAGRPPKSFEAIVLGGADQEIADLIWLVKPAGIESFGDEVVVVVDSQGFIHNIKFTRPVEKLISLEIDITPDIDFPVNGDQEVIANLLEYAQNNLSIGDDVIRAQLYCPITDVPGVVDVAIRMSFFPALPLDVPFLPIGEDEIAIFNSANILVTII